MPGEDHHHPAAAAASGTTAPQSETTTIATATGAVPGSENAQAGPSGDVAAAEPAAGGIAFTELKNHEFDETRDNDRASIAASSTFSVGLSVRCSPTLDRSF